MCDYVDYIIVIVYEFEVFMLEYFDEIEDAVSGKREEDVVFGVFN